MPSIFRVQYAGGAYPKSSDIDPDVLFTEKDGAFSSIDLEEIGRQAIAQGFGGPDLSINERGETAYKAGQSLSGETFTSGQVRGLGAKFLQEQYGFDIGKTGVRSYSDPILQEKFRGQIGKSDFASFLDIAKGTGLATGGPAPKTVLTPNEVAAKGGNVNIAATPTTQFKIPNVDTLNRLAAQGLTEADITRVGKDIFIKPESRFAGALIGSQSATPQTTPQIGQKIPNVDTLNALAKQGLTEADIVRVGKDIYLKPDSKFANALTGTEKPMTASEALNVLGIPEIPSEADLMDRVLASPEYQFLQERLNLAGQSESAKAEAAKAALDAKYEQDKQALEQKLSERGLTFSGIRTSQVRALGEALAASKLNEDRELAATLLDADLDFRENIYDLVADVVKDAQAGRKEALQMLKDQGLTIDPLTGKLVPTLEAKRYALSEARAETAEERALRADQRSEEYLALAKARFNRLGSGSGLTNYDYLGMRTALEKTKGSDGYINTDSYKMLRLGVKDKATFDKNYSWMLNPRDSSASEFTDPIKRMTSVNIDPGILQDLTDDVKGGLTLTELYSLYPDVSPSLVQDVYYNY